MKTFLAIMLASTSLFGRQATPGSNCKFVVDQELGKWNKGSFERPSGYKELKENIYIFGGRDELGPEIRATMDGDRVRSMTTLSASTKFGGGMMSPAVNTTIVLDASCHGTSYSVKEVDTCASCTLKRPDKTLMEFNREFCEDLSAIVALDQPRGAINPFCSKSEAEKIIKARGVTMAEVNVQNLIRAALACKDYQMTDGPFGMVKSVFGSSLRTGGQQ